MFVDVFLYTTPLYLLDTSSFNVKAKIVFFLCANARFYLFLTVAHPLSKWVAPKAGGMVFFMSYSVIMK